VRSALQAKCLCLAILSGIVGTASGADVDATSNNRVGVSEQDIAIHAYEPGSLKLEPQRGVTIPDYDPEGNRTDRVTGSSTRTYDYDRENRLLSVSEGTSQWRYDYDYRTRRVMREENGQPERISFSGGTSVQEYSAASSLHTPTVEYVRGSDMGGGIGGILYSVRGDTASFAHYNARGDVVAKSGSTGALTWQARYEGFGSRTTELGTNPDKQRANTREEEPWGGLYENMRWRDLETGQYFTRDPAGFVDGPNLYAYVSQNPWSKFDPLGLEERTDKDGYKWKEKGHHIVPRESVNEAGWDKSVKNIFDKATIDTPNGHNRTRHGHYSREVSAEMAEFVANRAPNGLTGVSAKDQQELAEEFVRQIQNSDNEFINGFNSHVDKGPGGVADWFDNKGGKDIVMKSTGLKAGYRFPGAVKVIQGFAKAAKVGGAVITKSMPVVNGALVLGPALSSGEDANGIARQVIMSASGAADLESATLWVGESAIKAAEHRGGTLKEMENWNGDMSAEDMINSFRKRGYR